MANTPLTKPHSCGGGTFPMVDGRADDGWKRNRRKVVGDSDSGSGTWVEEKEEDGGRGGEEKKE